MRIKSIRYVFPKTTDFRETRPTICWEHMYGWMEGYGTLFDPALLQLFGGTIPEWENGWNGAAADGDFFITSCRQASAAFGAPAHPGIYVRPAEGVDVIESERVSEKEGLRTPPGSCFYPVGYSQPLRYERYGSGCAGWEIGENPALAAPRPGVAAAAFEPFGMLEQLRGESPEQRLIQTADLLRAMLAETKCFPDSARCAGHMEELRLDFHAYGVMRLMVQWLLEKKGAPRGRTAAADAALRQALVPWTAGDAVGTRAALAVAFQELTAARRSVSKLHLHFLEFPHMGLLLEDKGWFELEWPHFTRKMLRQYSRWSADCGWQFALEGGASCWRNLARRYPDTIAEIRRLWDAGKLELTNGTYSLPFAMISPVLLQYWQFAAGQAAFREVFGRVPETYQAQEHSLTPQLPELLRLFGYRRALHMAQNRGVAPAEGRDFVDWQSPAGHGIAALVARDRSLASKGCNYYMDVPLVHADFGDAEQEIHYVNFMDFGSIPFRTPMVRAHRYAAVFGSYGTPAVRFPQACPPLADLPARRYTASDYRFAPGTFYRDATNANALSQPERVFALTHGLRQSQFAAWMAGRDGKVFPALAALFPDTCFQEAHDVMVVQDQRRGEFYKATHETPPYSRDMLSEAVAGRAAATMKRIEAVGEDIGGRQAGLLLNASETALDFARVRQPQRAAGALLRIGSAAYAVGDFPAWAAAAPDRSAALQDLPAAPKRWGLWHVGFSAEGALRLTRNGRTAEIAPVDSLHGAFACASARARAAGALLAMEITCRNATDFVQTVVLDVLLTKGGGLAEIALRYAPGRAFDSTRRWDDYLALEMRTGSPLAALWSFNPNVRGRNVDEKVSSPYCLGLENAGADPVSLLNEGAMVYVADHKRGTLRWLFHVANETLWQRRMALAFGTADAFQLSRAWSQGLLPFAAPPARSLRDWLADGWAGLSAEGFMADGRLLLTNLCDAPAEFALREAAPALSVCDVDGQDRMQHASGGARVLKLKAYELALARLG